MIASRPEVQHRRLMPGTRSRSFEASVVFLHGQSQMVGSLGDPLAPNTELAAKAVPVGWKCRIRGVDRGPAAGAWHPARALDNPQQCGSPPASAGGGALPARAGTLAESRPAGTDAPKNRCRHSGYKAAAAGQQHRRSDAGQRPPDSEAEGRKPRSRQPDGPRMVGHWAGSRFSGWSTGKPTATDSTAGLRRRSVFCVVGGIATMGHSAGVSQRVRPARATALSAVGRAAGKPKGATRSLQMGGPVCQRPT